MKSTIKLFCYGVLVALLNSAQVKILAQWNFNDTTTKETALSVSHVVDGVVITQLTPHDNLEFAGLNAAPKSEVDGYGFGRNAGRQVLFLKRAEQYASSLWGRDGTTAVEGAPLSQPVVVRKGESKAFTINLNSGQFSSSHGIDAIFLLGKVAP